MRKLMHWEVNQFFKAMWLDEQTGAAWFHSMTFMAKFKFVSVVLETLPLAYDLSSPRVLFQPVLGHPEWPDISKPWPESPVPLVSMPQWAFKSHLKHHLLLMLRFPAPPPTSDSSVPISLLLCAFIVLRTRAGSIHGTEQRFDVLAHLFSTVSSLKQLHLDLSLYLFTAPSTVPDMS